MHFTLAECWLVKPKSLLRGFFMSKRKPLTHSYYMVRLSGGEWPSQRKHKTLAKAVQEASRLAKLFNKPATVLATAIRVESHGDIAHLEDVDPEQ